MDLGPEQIRHIIQMMIILILSICVHEYGHAIVADKLGDRLPRSQGRVTLNPAAHADPIGTLAFPLIALVYTAGASLGFGWGKPVMVNPLAFNRKYRMRVAHMMVAAAGPAMNIIFGVAIAVVHVVLLQTGLLSVGSALNTALASAVALNFILCFFNLIPAPPLDGGAVVEGLLPDKYLPGFRSYSVYGPFVLMAVIFIPQLQWLFVTPAMFLARNLYSILALPPFLG